MKVFGYILVFLRMLLVVILMALMVTTYAVLSLLFNYGRAEGFVLRRLFMKYVFIPICNIKIYKTGDATTDRPTIYVANHRSLVDVIIFKYYDALAVAKSEVNDYPILNKGAEMTGVIWVKRDERSSRNAVKDAIRDLLIEGYNVHVFPEGTVSRDKGTLPYKRGSFSIAADMGVPIKPVVLEYRHKEDLWVQPSLLVQFIKVFSRWKTEVKVHFGPIMYGDDTIELTDRVEKFTNEKMHEMQIGWSTVFPNG